MVGRRQLVGQSAGRLDGLLVAQHHRPHLDLGLHVGSDLNEGGSWVGLGLISPQQRADIQAGVGPGGFGVGFKTATQQVSVRLAMLGMRPICQMVPKQKPALGKSLP